MASFQNINSILKKAQQSMYFLWQLKEVFSSTGAVGPALHHSHRILPVHIHHGLVWSKTGTNCSEQLEQQKNTSVLPCPASRTLQEPADRQGTSLDSSRPGHNLFQLLPSGRRYRTLYTKTTRHKSSFFSHAITFMNS